MSNPTTTLTTPYQPLRVLPSRSDSNFSSVLQMIPSHSTTNKSKRQRGVVLTEQGWQKLVRAGVLCDEFDRRYTYEELSERSLLDSRTVSRILSCEVKVDKRTLKAFFQAFNLSLEANDYTRPTKPKSDPGSKRIVNFAYAPSLSAATAKASLSVEELAELLPGIMQDLKCLVDLYNYISVILEQN
ncbi:hypothetical protein [Myxosarcina sp. GI1]|uniref:hypothetical protein n=1 Tax=Myxosarcina sp. GI1 TaxID=1541065 RepID=UPI00056B08BE|nr:hypothetical protein [Myxosarcina sp. GI1]